MAKQKTITAIVLIQGLLAADGKIDLETGESCTCDADVAKWAVDKGYAEYADTKSKTQPATNPDAESVTLAAFEAAVAQLDTSNEAHFTKSGKPDCGALADVGCDVSATERDTFWSELNPA